MVWLIDTESCRLTQEPAVQDQTTQEQVSQEVVPAGTSVVDQTPKKTFELVHQRLGHAGAYRLKDLHLYASGVEAFDVPTDFECEICDASKIIRTINREPRIKTTVPGVLKRLNCGQRKAMTRL